MPFTIDHLVLLRHGKRAQKDRLDQSNSLVIKHVVSQIAPLLPRGYQIPLISSTDRIAIDTALAVSSELDDSYEFVSSRKLQTSKLLLGKSLLGINSCMEQSYSLFEDVKGQACIAVGHLEFLEYFPQYLFDRLGSKNMLPADIGSDYLSGVYINLKDISVKKINIK